MEDKRGFWGPYSQRPTTSTSRPYFNGLVTALMDAGSLWDRLRMRPAGFPFLLLGRPSLTMREKQMFYPRDVTEILCAGGRLEYLTLRLQLLTIERDCFRVLAELKAPEPR
jgi:hypothetical protein